LLSAEGIAAVCVKGPALAALAFGDVVRRQFDDLDCVVPVGAMVRVNDLLTEAGYRRLRPSGQCSLSAYARTRQEWMYTSDEGQVIYDIKELPVTHSVARPDLTDFIVRTAVRMPVGNGRSILGASPEAMLLVLCLHGVHELWPKLSQVVDIAALLAGCEKLDWEMMRSQSGRLGHDRALFVGLGLARQLAHADLPPWVAEGISADSKSRQLIELAAGKLLSGQSTVRSPVHRERYECASLGGVRDKFRYLVGQTFVPGARDVRAFPWTARLFPLLYVLRPLRRFFEALTVLLGSGNERVH